MSKLTVMSNGKETAKEFALRIIRESKLDIDKEYCLENSIKFDNHEVNACDVNLFDKKSNKSAFDYVTSL